MRLSRRLFLGAAVGSAALVACGAPAPPAARAPAPTTPEALLEWMRANPAAWSLHLDDGRGRVVDHSPDDERPLASAVKVVHLAAYGRAVAAGTVTPEQPVTVAEWERWYVPGLDGGAHPQALARLGAGPGSTVRLDDVVAAMVDLSDNAAPDLLRAVLGDAALVEAAAAGGWPSLDVPSLGGESLIADGPELPRAQRRAAADAAARAYADDPAQRAEFARRVAETPAPATTDPAAFDAAVRYWSGAPAGSARHLATLHSALADGRYAPPRAAEIARGHLERGLAGRLPAGVAGLGQKGGNIPGVITQGMSVRRDDGTTGSLALLFSGLPVDVYEAQLSSGAFVVVAQQALLDTAAADRLAAAAG